MTTEEAKKSEDLTELERLNLMSESEIEAIAIALLFLISFKYLTNNND
jgi:hypothetical protein